MISEELKSKIKRNFWLIVLLSLAAISAYCGLLLAKSISPAYLWLLLLGAAFAFLAYLENRRLEKARLLAKLRREWGCEELNKEREFKEISALFELADQSSGAIDSRTWNDLNMDLVFAQVERTFSWPGSQRLYQILRSPELKDMSKIVERNTIISEFERDRKLRESVQVILSAMDNRIGSGLCTLLWGKPDIRPVHPLWVYSVMFAIGLLSPLLLIADVRYITAVLIIFQINMYLHFKVQKQIRAYFEGVRSLRQLLSVSKRLSSLRHEVLDGRLSEIRTHLAKVRRFNKIVRFVGIETTDPFMHMFQQYFTILFLAEVRGFYRALEFIDENRETVQSLFLSIGDLDAMQSVASYRASLKYYCIPRFVPERGFTLRDAYHPLLSDPVPNSIVVEDLGIMVTGSNMSGKSTFLRTIGLNALMAQTIGTCTAHSYQACPVRLLTSIGRSDNVVEGKSYYLEEALSVLRILDVVDDGIVTLVIFDELYRGTNSEERIFAAQRVLDYLVRRNALIFVATHDLELTDLLADTYSSFHFSERVGPLGLEFDYKLKKGPATTRNAIALLRYLGYPEEITKQE